MGVILKNTNGYYDLDLDENGKMQRGDTVMQEVELLLILNKGELKSDPLLGCNLINKVNTAVTASEIKSIVKVQLARDKKNYEDVKDLIHLKTTNQ